MIRKFERKDIQAMCEIWNEVVDEHNAFPQKERLNEETGFEFFKSQSFSGVFEDETGEIVGLYILHPNNIGHCGHLSNASYAVKKGNRGKKIGEQLVLHSLDMGKKLGFEVLQFNAVVSSNKAAIYLYEKLGFHRLGSVPKGFKVCDGVYEDIVLYYKEL